MIARIGTAAMLAMVVARGVSAQRAGWIPLDDPLSPVFEHLVERGDVADPRPQVRPVRRDEAVRALRAAACAAESWCGHAVTRLLAAWDPAARRQSLQVQGAAGAQSETAARRDPLYPAGAGRSLEPYARLAAHAEQGALVLDAEGVDDPRAPRDPDRGRHTFGDVRLSRAFAELALPFGDVTAGSLPRNWGPVGVEGLARSSSGYPFPEVTLDIGGHLLHVGFEVARLDDTVAADTGRTQRWFGMHRLDFRPSRNFDLSFWETVVAQGERRNGDNALDGMLSMLSFEDQFGVDAQRNTILGFDGTWWPVRALRMEGQIAIDDHGRSTADPVTGELPHPNRYAFTGTLGGPLGAQASWRAIWTRVSNLAYRTIDPRENFLDDGTPLGPLFSGHDLMRIEVGVPVTTLMVVHPEFSILKQGEGSIQTPFVLDSLPNAPELFAGTVRRTFRLALRADGSFGRIVVSGNGGVNFDHNADNVANRSRTHFEGSITVTIGAGHRWTSRE